MGFQRFGIDSRLAAAAEGLKIDFFYYEKLLAQALEKGQNVCAKLSLSEGREEVLLLPVLQWLLSGESRRALVLSRDPASAEQCLAAIARLGTGAGISSCRAVRDPGGGVRIEGDPAAAVLVGCFDDLLELEAVDLRSYGYLVVDGADRVAEQPSQAIHRFVGLLLPPWERRSLLACAKISVKAKNLAFDLADNPVEIAIDGEVIKAQSVAKETWNLAGEDKLKFLLGLLEREKPFCACIFCNLKDTAQEVAKRLEANGIGADYILGALAADRKLAILEASRSGEKPCLVLTDQGAESLSHGVFPLVVNYDIPLEPELFVRRLEMLDRERPGAKVVSLACDRYIYGLSAVESYIEAKLETRPVDPAMFAAEDRSEGLSFEPRSRRIGADRPEGRGPRRDGRDGYRRDSQQRRDGPRSSRGREDRSPDIRRSISDITGGSLDIGVGNSPAEGTRSNPESGKRQPGRSPSSGQGERRGGRQQGDSSRRQGGARSSSRGDGRGGTKQPQRGSSGKKRSLPRRPAGEAPASEANPYDTPIEERMKRYREKYGQDIGEKGPEAQQPRRDSDSHPPRDRSGKEQPRRHEPPASAPEVKPKGFLGQLFGSFGKKVK